MKKKVMLASHLITWVADCVVYVCLNKVLACKANQIMKESLNKDRQQFH